MTPKRHEAVFAISRIQCASNVSNTRRKERHATLFARSFFLKSNFSSFHGGTTNTVQKSTLNRLEPIGISSLHSASRCERVRRSRRPSLSRTTRSRVCTLLEHRCDSGVVRDSWNDDCLWCAGHCEGRAEAHDHRSRARTLRDGSKYLDPRPLYFACLERRAAYTSKSLGAGTRTVGTM